MVTCTAPGSGGLVGNVTVELVGEEGRVGGSNGVRFEYRRDTSTLAGLGTVDVRDVAVEGIAPSLGRLSGGTMVTMTGSGLRWAGMGVMKCRFGAMAAGAARATSSSMVQCMTPGSMDGGRVVVGLEVDGRPVWEGGEAYVYEAAASVEGLRPGWGTASEDHTVTVMGRHFSNTGALACRVGMGRETAARWLTSSSVACVVPAA